MTEIKIAKGLIKKNSKKFTGAWVSAFEKLINDYEGVDFDMKGSIGRVYENAKKTTASYFKASAKCNEQNCKTTYSLIIDKKPKDNDSQGFIEVIITRDQQHNHTSMKNKQLRGEKRLRVAEECIANSNGSANDYVEKLIGGQVLAGEEIPENIQEKSKSLKAVVRNAVNEYLNQEMVSFGLNVLIML
jgi:hypothetical protein